MMDYDDIGSISLALFDFLIEDLKVSLTDSDYDKFHDKVFDLLDQYSIGAYRNYN